MPCGIGELQELLVWRRGGNRDNLCDLASVWTRQRPLKMIGQYVYQFMNVRDVPRAAQGNANRWGTGCAFQWSTTLRSARRT